MVLNLIGLGLGDAKDVTLRGLELIRRSKYLYLESYTSILPGMNAADLEKAYGPLHADCTEGIVEADRTLVESGCEEMLERAKTSEVSFLVVGDALCATTHTDLYLRAKERGIEVQVVHNASELLKLCP